MSYFTIASPSPSPSTSPTPRNRLVTTSDWQSLMTKTTLTSSFNIIESGSPPDVQMQLMSKSSKSAATNVYHEYPIQQASGFVASFDIKMTQGADELFFFAGGSGPLPCDHKITNKS